MNKNNFLNKGLAPLERQPMIRVKQKISKRGFSTSSLTGFTIVELLVVVAIAAFILSFVFVFFRDAKAKGRDARREEDIKQLQNSLNIYHINRRQFPVCELGVINGSGDCLSQVFFAEEVANAVPIDPLGGGTGTCLASAMFVYCYESDGSEYALHYDLETDSIPGKLAGWQEVNP